jgi:hypothetical protein
MLMENNFKFDWLQAVFIQKNPKRTLQVWHLKEPLVLGTLTSLTIPAYEIVYRSASMLVDNWAPVQSGNCCVQVASA